ncbi:MAG: EamA family transporter [Rickettsiales bacterium]|nr:EamA family transporter [Rickettsiales bacterium]
MSWTLFTFFAVILQTFRNLEQKNLNKKLDTLTVSWSRFILPLPLAIIGVTYSFLTVDNWFIFHCLIAAIFQIGGNSFLLKTIKSKNFGVGVAFYKTEVLQALLVGTIFFNQQVSALGVLAIFITTIGMVLMANINFSSQENFFKKLDKSALFGTFSGSCFAVSSFNLKFAAQRLIDSGNDFTISALLVLLWIIFFQNIFFLLVKSSQNRLRQDLKNLFSAENKFAFVKTGCLSFAGSFCWFCAFAIGNVVYVKAMGQLELVFAVAISYFYLKERHSFKEFLGIIFTAFGIFILVLFH